MLRAIILVLLLVPAAQACSFTKEPPGPGVFYVWDTHDPPISVAVTHRGLGGTCELSNLNAVDQDRFVWLEGSTIHVLDLGDLTRSHTTWSGDTPQDLALADGQILVRENTGREREHRVWALADGSKQLLYSTTQFGRLHGGYYVTEPGQAIVDVRTAEVVAEAGTGYPGNAEPYFIGTDGRFVVYANTHSGATAYHIHDLMRSSWRQVTLDTSRYGEQVGDGWLYTARDGNVTIIDLATGTRSEARAPDIALLGAGGGQLVLGAYSEASVSGAWRPSSADQNIPLPLWPILLVLVSKILTVALYESRAGSQLCVCSSRRS